MNSPILLLPCFISRQDARRLSLPALIASSFLSPSSAFPTFSFVSSSSENDDQHYPQPRDNISKPSFLFHTDSGIGTFRVFKQAQGIAIQEQDSISVPLRSFFSCVSPLLPLGLDTLDATSVESPSTLVSRSFISKSHSSSSHLIPFLCRRRRSPLVAPS